MHTGVRMMRRRRRRRRTNPILTSAMQLRLEN
jgi:hypothetical protein